MVMASVTPTKSFFVDDVNSKQFFEKLIQPPYQNLLIYTDFFKNLLLNQELLFLEL